MTQKRFIQPYKECRVIKNTQTGETATYYDTEDGFMFLEWLNNLLDENEQLKQVLGNILLEVKRDITNTSCTGEVKAFINPNSYDLISDVLRRYSVLKEWYDD